MSKQIINIGRTANDRSGDPLRTAFEKVNSNFDELYATVGADAAANQLVNGNKTVSLASTGVTTFPTFQTDTENLIIQGTQFGSENGGLSLLVKNQVLISTDILGTAKTWQFEPDGKLTLPDGTTYEYLNAPLTGHGDGLARLDFTLVTDGVATQWAAATASPAGSGYSAGDTFTFYEEFLGIAGASVTIEVLTVGDGGSVGDLAFSMPPLYPADIYRDSPINLQVGPESNRWTFGATGNLTLPASGFIKNSDGSTYSTDRIVNGAFDVHIQSDGSLVLPNGDAASQYQGTIQSLNESSVFDLDVQTGSDILGGIRLSTWNTKPVDIVTNKNSGGGNLWRFGTDGNTTMPGQAAQPYRLLASQYGYYTATTTVVIFTGTPPAEATKATIHVKGSITVGTVSTTYHQICEMLIARKDSYDSNTSINTTIVEAMVYGVTHSSVDPIATFDARYNSITMCFEITMVRDPAYTGVNAKVIATESVNLD